MTKEDTKGNQQNQNEDEDFDDADENNNSNSDNNDAQNDDAGDDKGGENEKTFSQSEVSSMMAKEKKQGKKSAYNELGINPNDKKTISMIKAFIKSQSAGDEDSDDSKNNNDSELERRTEIAETKAEAMIAGIKKEFIDDAVVLIMAKKSNSDDSEIDLKTLINELKTKYPVWFDSDDSKDDSIGSKGTGRSLGSRSDNNSGKAKSLGERLAAQRKGQSKQSSYWKANK